MTLPLALPSIAVAGLIAFLLGYTEFAIGWLFVDHPDTVTLAMAVLMALPVVLIFILLRRYLLQGALPGVRKEKE